MTNYVLTQDTGAIVSRVLGCSDPDLNNSYFDSLAATLRASNLGQEFNIVEFREADICNRLEAAVTQRLQENPKAFCITLDRFLLDQVEQDYPERFARLSITRTLDGEKVSRGYDQTIAAQIASLKSRVKESGAEEIIIVDDGIFSGGTMSSLLQRFKEEGLSTKEIIVFLGKGQTELEQVPVDIIQPVDSLLEWIDPRDFSIFGGRQVRKAKPNQPVMAIPYLAPWSDGSAASLDRSPDFFKISKEMIVALNNLLVSYEAKGVEPLTFAALEQRNFPIPKAMNEYLVATPEMTVVDYLESCLRLIEQEERRAVNVFDMDGTLYYLDGVNNGFKGSTLEARIRDNAVTWIQEQENVNRICAEGIFEQAKLDPVGASEFLSKRYDVRRVDYFNVAWNVDPDFIVPRDENIQKVIELQGGSFGADSTKAILLTSAPGIWARKVMKILGLRGSFEAVYTGESYETKSEIFKLLAGRYTPSLITSFGDQQETDIKPAIEYGMNGQLV